jgi:hypothetical protein
MRARIFRLEKSPMQSGKSQCSTWRLAFEPENPKPAEPLMGWTSTTDTWQQVQLDFPTREGAMTYADAHGIAFELYQPAAPVQIVKAYGDNFSSDRKIPWSH